MLAMKLSFGSDAKPWEQGACAGIAGKQPEQCLPEKHVKLLNDQEETVTNSNVKLPALLKPGGTMLVLA